jgi:hypothetical protein
MLQIGSDGMQGLGRDIEQQAVDRHRPAARSDQSAGEAAQDLARGALPCPKSRTSSARMGQRGDRQYS